MDKATYHNPWPLIALGVFLLAVTVFLVWLLNPPFASNVVAALLAAAILSVVAYLYRITRISKLARIWSNRDSVTETIRQRIRRASASLFFVGFTFETVFNRYKDDLVTALNTKENLIIRILMIHPDSKHVEAHQPFSDRTIKEEVVETVNNRLRSLFGQLTQSAKRRIEVRATHYLPRFAARVFDDKTMLLNFYLYKYKAEGNPVIEIRSDNHKEEFKRILGGLNELYRFGEGGRVALPNHRIVHAGKWYGLP